MLDEPLFMSLEFALEPSSTTRQESTMCACICECMCACLGECTDHSIHVVEKHISSHTVDNCISALAPFLRTSINTSSRVLTSQEKRA
jgi:hypothetical protein